jgi:hypothetical protein
MGKISQLLREYILGLSIVLIIIGAIIFVFGTIGILMPEFMQNTMSLDTAILDWSPYIFGLGAIILISGIYYLYAYEKNKRFLLEEIETNKRSEFVKMHSELKKAVRTLPQKYQDMLHEKEKELKIK